jgi:ABC-type transport system substrate-binding protein
MTVGSVLARGAGKSPRGLTKRMGVVAFVAVAVAACGSGTTGTSPSGSTSGTNVFDPTNFDTAHVSWLAANQNASGTPVKGGTLLIEGSADLGAFGDPQGEYETQGYGVMRTYARTLVTYPASSTLLKAESIVPDAAASMPTVSSDGLTYTFTLRPGLMWNTTPPRPVTSQDFERGILRNCDPGFAGYNNTSYYTATIVGYATFCTAFGKSAGEPKDSAMLTNAKVAGMQTPDSTTIVFTLTEPAVDFLNILAMDFAAAAPVEVLKEKVLTPGNIPYSDGPYYIKTYNVAHEIILDRNPEWSQSTDPVRHQYVNEIDIKTDLSAAAASTQVQQDMQAGTADLAWNTVVPTASIQGLETPTWNAGFGTYPAPGGTNPYLIFNLLSPNNSGALGNVKVRQALEYAIDKVAITKIYGGAAINEPLNQVLGPGAQGYVAFNDYPTKNNQGDGAKCASLLKAAGVTSLTLKYYYRNSGNHPAVYQSVATNLKACGVTVTGIPIASGQFYTTAGIASSSAATLKAGNWDITDAGWGPDWFGPTNARSILPDLFTGANFPGTDWGDYDNPAVDTLVSQAESATTLAAANSLWHQADQKIMADAPFVPVMTSLQAIFHSTRVHNAIYFPFSEQYDLTQIWLSS